LEEIEDAGWVNLRDDIGHLRAVWINSEPPRCFRLVSLSVVSPDKTAALALVALEREPSPIDATVQNGNFCLDCETQLLTCQLSFAIVLDEMLESCDLDRALLPRGPCGSVMAVASRLWDPIRFDGHHRFGHDFKFRLFAKSFAKLCSFFADEIVLITQIFQYGNLSCGCLATHLNDVDVQLVELGRLGQFLKIVAGLWPLRYAVRLTLSMFIPLGPSQWSIAARLPLE